MAREKLGIPGLEVVAQSFSDNSLLFVFCDFPTVVANELKTSFILWAHGTNRSNTPSKYSYNVSANSLCWFRRVWYSHAIALQLISLL